MSQLVEELRRNGGLPQSAAWTGESTLLKLLRRWKLQVLADQNRDAEQMTIDGGGDDRRHPNSERIFMRISPSSFLPRPRQTPQNVSFQLFPSVRSALPVASSLSRRSA
jgi:hypothetical protein